MKVLAWVSPETWRSVIEEVNRRPETDVVRVIAVVDVDHDLPPGLLDRVSGRGRAARILKDLSEESAERALAKALSLIELSCESKLLKGPTARVVVEECEWADVLILARDGDRSRLGPRSIGRNSRFVIDHAPCSVTIIWPGSIPSSGMPLPPK